MSDVRLLTPSEKDRGYMVCSCGKFAHVMRAEVLRRLPADYSGELCHECGMWMCRLDLLEASENRAQ